MTTALETAPTASSTSTATEQAVPSWGDAISDPEVLGYIQKKGWSAPADIVQGYRNLEKLVGNEKVPLSKGEQDTEGWERVFTALGRPSTPDAYKLPDADTAAKFHEVGLNTRQAEALSGWLGESRERATKTAAEEAASKRLAEPGAVRSEWGVAGGLICGEFQRTWLPRLRCAENWPFSAPSWIRNRFSTTRLRE
jgi:hypothetical protein